MQQTYIKNNEINKLHVYQYPPPPIKLQRSEKLQHKYSFVTSKILTALNLYESQ